jgi:hypothetical protein
MRDFQAEFGLIVPRLTSSQRYRNARTLCENEGDQVVPTLLPKQVWRRKAQAALIEGSVLQGVVRPDIMFMPEERGDEREDGQVLNRLWTPRNGPLFWKQNLYLDLRYKVPGLPIERSLNRRGYIGALLAAGQAVLGEDGSVWTFPVMDVSDSRRPDYAGSESHYRQVDPIISPEARINVQVLHMVAGKPKNEDVTEHVNEAVYLVDKRGRKIAFKGVAGVTWAKVLEGRIRFAWWSEDSPLREAEVPRGVSGL